MLPVSDVYMHHICALERDYGDTIVTGGSDIIMSSTDGGDTFRVHEKDYVSRGAKK